MQKRDRDNPNNDIVRAEVTGTIEMEGPSLDIRLPQVKAIVHPAEEGGYWAEVPLFPGCVTQGETLDEIVLNLDDAIRAWLQSQTQDSLRAQGIEFTPIVQAENKEEASSLPLARLLEFAA